MRSWFISLIAWCLTGSGIVFAQDASSQSAESALPTPESIGTGWSLSSSDAPTDLARPFRDAATALYAGPNGARARVTVLLVVEGMTAIRESWELSNDYFESLRSETDYDFDSGRERELDAQPLPTGCDDARRTYGRDELFGDAFPVGITLCAADPDMIVLALASGDVEGETGYEASDHLVELVVFEDSGVGEGEIASGDDTAMESIGSMAPFVDVVSHDIYFEPTEITIPANTDLTFVLLNEGATAHNFSIDALGIDVDQAPGTTEEVVVNAPAGEYEYYCNVPGHEEAGMVGTLIVSEEAGAAPAEAGVTAATPAAAVQATPEAAAEAAGAAAETVEVVSYDIDFEPNEVTIPANTDVTFVLPNNGATLHNFSIDALGIDIDQAPGETQEIVITAPAGEYEFYCNVPGHKEAGMVGTLTIE